MADIILVSVIAFFALRGAKRGFARSLVGIISTVLSLVISVLLYKGISGLMYASPIGDAVRGSVEGFLAENTSGAVSFIMNTQSGVDALTMLCVNALSFLIVIIVAKIIVSFIAGAINIAARLPLIKQANSLIGMAIGIISGAVFCYIAIGIIAAMGATFPNAVKMIEGSVLSVTFYENNLITNILAAFMK